MPGSWQDKILRKVIASNRWNRVQTFNMLFKSFVLMGGGRKDILSAFQQANDLDRDFYNKIRDIAQKREEIALQTNNREEFQKALLLYFLADWVTFEKNTIHRNYKDLLRISKVIDKLAKISTRKVYFPWKIGHIACRYRVPNNSEKTHPLVMLVQGNDTVKEALLFIEDWLLEANIAVLNIDQSGWGESLLSGNHFESLNDAKLIAEEAYQFLEKEENIDLKNLAIFGFSGGGTWAAMTAGGFEKLNLMISVGGAIFKLDYSIKNLPQMQKRQVMKHWGVPEKEFSNILPSLDFTKILPNIKAKCLLVHGENDTLVPVKFIHKAAKFIKGHVDMMIIKDGDHMCSDTLKDIQLPNIKKWIQKYFGMV